MKLNKNDWEYHGRWIQPTLSAHFWGAWDQDNNFPFGLKGIAGSLLYLDGHFFFLKKDFAAIKEFIVSHVNDDLLTMLQKWVDEVSGKIQRVKFENRWEGFEKVCQAMQDLTNPWNFFVMIDKSLEAAIEDVCRRNKVDVAEFAAQIHPIKKLSVAKKAEEAARLLKNIEEKRLPKDMNIIKKKDPDLAEKTEDHLVKFSMTGVHHFIITPYTVNDFFASSSKVPREKRKINLPKELEWWQQLLNISTYARMHMAELSGLVQYHAKNCLYSAAKKIGISYEDMIWLSEAEINRALINPSHLPDYNQRKNAFGMLTTKDNEVIFAGGELDNLLRQFQEKKPTNFPLKGRVACSGNVTGKAVIVLTPKDLSKVEEGCIIICPETTPDFIAGIKKAAGIITEIGGITSHAAIVSRELNIPCIIGVKGATEIIKDGNKIMLDAMTGTISRI